MRLKISHSTTYSYDRPVSYALLQLRLTPRNGPGQTVIDWESTLVGATRQAQFEDQYRNRVELVLMDEAARTLTITSQGEVETQDLNGVIGTGQSLAPLWLFRADTPSTAPGPTIRALASPFAKQAETDPLDAMHRLSEAIGGAVTYEQGRTNSATTGEESATAGRGVCQDHTHILISGARHLGLPARYVSGYLMMDDRTQQDASHAWAEIWIDRLGWVGFDVSNAVCPDDRYVRVAVGRDYVEAAPIHGLRHGNAEEELCVSLQVQQ